MENPITNSVPLNFPQGPVEVIACLNNPDWPVDRGEQSGAWEMAQQGKALNVLAWQPEFGLWNSHEGVRTEPTA